MTETYRKWGRAMRFENGTVVQVDEAGEAIDGAEFVVRPLAGDWRPLPALDAAALVAAARSLETPAVERLVMAEGVAVHEYRGVVWSEHTRRLHLSIAMPPVRVLVDEADFAIGDDVLQAAGRFAGWREAGTSILLAPQVAAAILPLLIDDIAMEQRGDGESRDGRGSVIETCRVTGGMPPNWYRPSYRVRPLRTWFHLAALPFGRMERTVPRGVALLAPPVGRSISVLCDDGYARTVRIGRIASAGEAERWYPYGAGTWGAAMLLES